MAAKKQSITKASAGVSEILANLDVDMVGVTVISDLKGTKLKESALKLLPSARSIVIVGMEIYPEFLDLSSPERITGAASINDLLRRHTDIVAGKLTAAVYKIAREMRKFGLKTMPLPAEGPCVDSRFLEAIISYKHAAEAAGLGRIGLSSLVVTHQYGPRVRFALCLTDALLKSTANNEPPACNYCNICVAKCPAQALSRPEKSEPYSINKFACRTYFDAAGGCSECMRVCPVASPIYK
jgi:epoxyqueuosine reductase